MNETLIRSGADENYLLRLFYSFAKPSVRHGADIIILSLRYRLCVRGRGCSP